MQSAISRAHREHKQELRLALAMRGGVSLAVWMGGACAEIDALRRARPASDQNGASGGQDEPPPAATAASAFWAPLLEIAGYHAVRIDVLAGTSAGGLNSVLLATSVKYGVDFDAFRDLWLDVADLRKLVRSTDEPNPQSLLKGDAHFLVTIRDVLERCLAGRVPNSSFVDVSLTGTILDAIGKPSLDDLGTPSLEPSHRAVFRFRANIGTTDFPAVAPASADTATSIEQRPSQETLNRGLAAKLALAARSTSSFPGAFEPAQVQVRRPGANEQVGRRSPATDGADNLFGQFSDAARTDYNVIDGGVLDNIPVTRAIHAVAGSPASIATRRYLLYLDPSPRVAGSEDEAETPTDLVSTLSGAGGAKGTAESVLDDIEELRRHNAVAVRYRALQRTITAQLAAGPTLFASPEMLRASNEQRATLEASRIRALLQDPVLALGEDPFPEPRQAAPLLRPPLSPDAPYRPLLDQDALDGLERELAQRLVEALPTALESPAAARQLGYPTLVRSAMALLEVARSDEANDKDRGTLKERLYGVHRVAALLEHIGELFWPVHAAANEPRLDADGTWTTWAEGALERRSELLQAVSVPQRPSADVPEPWAAYRWLHDEVIQVRSAAPALAGRADLRDLIWTELVAVAQILARDPVPGTDAPLRPVIEGADDVARALLIYEVATQPLQTVSPRPPLPLAFLRVSSAVRSPAADRLFGGRRLTAKTKLTGNEVMNFAAFYKASWRANDWMWGRLDAAAAMVNLLVRPDELATRYGPGDVGRLLTLIEGAVTSRPQGSTFRQSGMDVASWQARLDGLWASRKAEIRAELEDLFARGAAEQRLEVLRETVSERRQLELLCTELPVVVDAATGDQLTVANRALNEAERSESLLVHTARTQVMARERVSTPDKLKQLCAEYEVGSEELVGEIGRAGFTELLAQLLVVAWRAIRASTKVPAFLRPVGIVLHSLRAAAVGVVRAPRWAVAVLPVIAVLALIATWRGGLGPFGRTTAAAVLVGVAVAVFVPVLRAPWLRAGAAALVLAVGAFLGWRSWANRGALREQLDQLTIPAWLQGEPMSRLSSIALAVLAGLAVAALYRRWSPAGRRGPSASSRPIVTWLEALVLVAALLVVLGFWFADTIVPWLTRHVNAASIAAVLAGAAAALVVAVALLIAARLSQSLYVAVLTGVLVLVLLVRPPTSGAEAAGLTAAALAATAIGGYVIYRAARAATVRRSSSRGPRS